MSDLNMYRLFGRRQRGKWIALTTLFLLAVCFLLHVYFMIHLQGHVNGNMNTRQGTYSIKFIPHVFDNHFWKRNCPPHAYLKVPGDSKLLDMCIYHPIKDVYISSSVRSNHEWEFHLVKNMLGLMLKDAVQYQKSGAATSSPKRRSGRPTNDICLVDLGCNIGVFTLSAASRGFSVLAVDALETSLQLLSASLLRNNLSAHVTLVNNAISNTRGPVYLKVSSRNKGGSFVHHQDVPQMNMTNVVSAICLDDLVPYVPTNRVFLKMDIETFEANALRCADDFFRRLDVPYVLLEWMSFRNTSDGAYIIEYFTNRGLSPHDDIRYINTESETTYLEIVTRQRNSLSRMLNEIKMDMGQQICTMLELRGLHGEKVGPKVSESGGWCMKESRPNSTEHMFDKPLADALGEFLRGQTVASFGDGPGMYKAHLDKQGLVTSYDGYDGAPFVENVTSGAVHFMDLTVPQYGIPIYQWVISLEVAEHIPKKFEDIFISNIVRHARIGVILSWAVPGQGGYSHVNMKTAVQVDEIMATNDFVLQEEASTMLKKSATLGWFRRNLRVYRRKPGNLLDENNA